MQNENTQFELRPGVGSALAYGWNKMKANFIVFFLVALVLVLSEVPIDLAHEDNPSRILGLIIFAYWLLLWPVIQYSADLMFLRGVRGGEVEVKEIVAGFQNYLNVVLASLLTFGLIGIALILLVIPGIFVACRLVFVSYLVMDEGLDPIEAVETSWRITKGHGWKIFLLGLMSIFICLFGLLLLFVGIFPAIMWTKSAFAALYLSMTHQGPPATTLNGDNE